MQSIYVINICNLDMQSKYAIYIYIYAIIVIMTFCNPEC